MTSLSKTISHGYDPSIVYHSHSSNVPHLANWISELVALTESSYPKNPTPSTDDLVHALQRYDAVFRELFRQTSIFSEPITKMLAQAWAGVIKLLDYMIKSYHRYVKHTSHLQTQAHNLLNDRQRSEAAHKIQKEEADLERTSLRARIRSLESELESMKLMRAGMEEENHKMRRIISVYIQSSDLNDPAWDVMDEDDMGGVETLKRGLQKKYANQDAVVADQQEFGFKRRDVIDAGHAQLKTLNRLDVELNEILANVLKEENRQRLLMQSLLKLIDKNKDQFFSAEEINDAEEADWIGIMSANRKDKDYAMSPVNQHSPSFSRQMSGKSLSMKLSRQGSSGGIAGMNSTANSSTATLGDFANANVPVSRPLLRASLSAKVPSQLSVHTTMNSSGGLLNADQLTAREIAAINTTAGSYNAFQNSQSNVHHNTYNNTNSNSGANTSNSVGHGANSPAHKGSRMTRSQSMMALTTGFAILGSDLNKKCDVGVQVDEKDEFGCVDEEPCTVNLEETMALGVAPLPPVSIHIKGKEFPFLIRRRMHIYPKLLRVPPVVWTCTMIMNIYLDKIQMDEERASMGLRKQNLPDHVYDYFMRTTGLKSAADVHVAQLLKACEAHNRRQPRIALFASQLGLNNPEETPPLDVRDSDFVLHVLSCLLRQGELMPDMFKSLKTKSAVIKSSVLLRPDVLRISATHLVQDTFAKLLPDGGDDFVMKVKAMQSTEKGFRYVDVDNLVDLLMDPWHTVRLNFEDHARFLFREFCGVHRVLQEATFANDEGVECTDTVLMEIKRTVAMDCTRRPLRMFQRIEDKGAAKHDDDRGGANNAANNPNNPNATTNTNKEPVCEAMNKKQFMECLHQINPAITTQEALDLFQEGLDIAHENVLRCLELMWMRFMDDASHYNHITVGGAVSSSDNKNNNNNGKIPVPPSSPSGGQRHGQQLHGHKHLGTNRDYWVNMRTQVSQWTRPYLHKAFRAQDLEMETFVTVLVRNDVLAKSPLLENIVNLPPRDLWPNAETFLKQMRDKARRGGGNAVAATPHPAALQSAGRIGAGVSFSSDRPSSSGSSTAGNIRTQLPNLNLRVPPPGEDGDGFSDDNNTSKPHSPTGKKFFGTGNSTPAMGVTHNNTAGGGFNAQDGNNARKSTAGVGSGVPPSGKGNKDRKKSSASAGQTAGGIVPAPSPSMVKPGSAKRTTSGSA